MVHTVSIQGEVLGRSEVITRLQQIAYSYRGISVWIGRNLRVIENTWYQRLIWSIFADFCGFEWCKNWYNVDYEKSKDSLLEIKQIFKDDKELMRLFVEALSSFNYHTSNTNFQIVLDPFEHFCFNKAWFLGVLRFSSNNIQTADQLEYLLDQDPTIDHLSFESFQHHSGNPSYNLAWDKNKVMEFFSLINKKYPSRIKGISLHDGFDLKDEDLALLKDVPLQSFVVNSEKDRSIPNLQLTPACLQQLDITKLFTCDLSGFGNDVRDEHLAVLAKALPLEHLRFRSKNVTENALKGLDLRDLETFYYDSDKEGMFDGGCGDKFLEILGSRACSLEYLDMGYSYVTKEGLRHMQARNLKLLRLNHSNASKEELLETLSNVNVDHLSNSTRIELRGERLSLSALDELRGKRDMLPAYTKLLELFPEMRNRLPSFETVTFSRKFFRS
ncbi:MAG: hypothetical protein P4L16_03105 [Chlamydiales bacterium]|nr:hypothetical protein [Chlamydiales bacterium]